MAERVKICIHRGSHQIGGCCTEIECSGTRIAIDVGSTLPGEDNSPLEIDGLTVGDSSFNSVFISHYHGDHIGELQRVNSDMGKLSRALIKEYQKRSTRLYQGINIEKIKEISLDVPIKVGNMDITAIRSDHSAADPMMFYIKAGDISILHTGDFRLHGRFRDDLMRRIADLGMINLLITEGTTLSRSVGDEYTEDYVRARFTECIQKYRYCFFILSSGNIDRMQMLSESVPRGRYFIVDGFQKSLLEIAERYAGDRYTFPKKTVMGSNILEKMEKRGFAMVIRSGERREPF